MSVLLGASGALAATVPSVPQHQVPYAAPAVYDAHGMASYVRPLGTTASYAPPGIAAVAGPRAVASYVPPAWGAASFVPNVRQPPYAQGPPTMVHVAPQQSMTYMPHQAGTQMGVASPRGPPQMFPQEAAAPSEQEPLTRGFPDPASIAEQKEAYNRSLDLQLDHGHQSLQAQHKERKQQLYEAAEKRKAALMLQVEQQMKIQEMALDEQTNQAMMGLKKAALDQKAALEQQAAALTLEYQQRKMQEEFAATQVEIQRQYMESHNQLQTEVQTHYDSCQKMQSHAQTQQVQGPAAHSFVQMQGPPPMAYGMVPANHGSYGIVPVAAGRLQLARQG